jgi:MPBQ/MSBQ methyltransferase
MTRANQGARFREYAALVRGGASRERSSAVGIQELYDVAAAFVARNPTLSPYMNHGYWTYATADDRQASENLMQKVVMGIEMRCAGFDCFTEPVLDVACGLGGGARFLSNRWRSESIYGINITERQLEVCRRTAPACVFARMDATDLKFANAQFGSIICIEAAFQFRTRERFIEQAFRTLKPGGVLALTDALLTEEAHVEPHKYSAHYPAENYLPSVSDYRSMILGAGFCSCDILDITEEGSRSFFRYMIKALHERWLDGTLSLESLRWQLDSLYLIDCVLMHEMLCFATKSP